MQMAKKYLVKCHMGSVYGLLVSVRVLCELLQIEVASNSFIAMTPFAKNLAEKLGKQVHQRAIQTDPYCQVLGISDGSMYAIGDCATIKNPKLLEHIMEIFEANDKLR